MRKTIPRSPFRRYVRLLVGVPIAMSIVLLMRLIRPLVVVRIGALKSDRIGHFVLETELMILEQLAGIKPAPPNAFDIYYAPPTICNSQIETMWSRVIRMWPRWLMIPVFRINQRIPGAQFHVIPSATATCLDVHNLLDRTAPMLQFEPKEVQRGRKLMNELGIKDREYVCVIARDRAYYRTVLSSQNLEYHEYRNWDINAYVEPLESLADEGPYVVRMGAVVEEPLRSSHPKVIDYANSGLRSAFGDVWLGANCKFCVSDGLGYFAVPAAFRRPNAYINFSPMHLFYSSRGCDLGITKLFEGLTSGELIPFSQLVDMDVAYLTRIERISDAGLRLRDNSVQEVRELLLEMNARIDGRWIDQTDEDQLQKAFWKQFERLLGEDSHLYHGEFRARIGSQFLRAHSKTIFNS